MKICVPSLAPGGLDAIASAHFGHCEVFTIVEMDEHGSPKSASVIDNSGEHNCMIPVQKLLENKVDIVLISGIGRNPLYEFQRNGIKVYIGAVGNVRDAIEDFIGGYLKLATPDDVCRGGCHS
jgi:predicted Fe-Mo cluster-binding NifX family protein